MFKKNKILVIIPARGGSKGVKLKNLQKINGKSLTEITIKVAKKISIVDKIIISTDHHRIAKVALKNNIQVPFMRPKKYLVEKFLI